MERKRHRSFALHLSLTETKNNMVDLQEAPTSPRPKARAKWRLRWGALGLAILILTGMGVTLYPHVASWISQYYQSQLIEQVTDPKNQQAKDPSVEDQLRDAHEYNSLLVGGAFLAADANKPEADAYQVGEFQYNEMLKASDSGIMGRLRIPSIKVDLPVYHGTSDETLLKGVGHLEGTSLPVGGLNQHSVLTAHRGLPQATLFNDLGDVKLGDTFTVEVLGEVLTYRVMDSRVVDPTDTDSLRVVAGNDLMTLVTCTPLGINTHRILVTGERITPTPIKDVQSAGATPNIPGFPWWTLWIGGTVIVLTGYVWKAGSPRPQQTKERLDVTNEPQES